MLFMNLIFGLILVTVVLATITTDKELQYELNNDVTTF